MTVQTKFINWQQRPDLDWKAPPYEADSPNLVAGLHFLTTNFGGVNLGIQGNRNIRNGQAPSTHAYSALDWRWGYHDAYAGRDIRWVTVEQMQDEVLPLLTSMSQELGINAIHRGRIGALAPSIWRPPGHSGRAATADGWRNQNTGYGEWIHIEPSFEEFERSTPWADILDGYDPSPIEEKPVIFDPANAEYGLYPFNQAKRPLKLGQEGEDVLYLQWVLWRAGYNLARDRWFGKETLGVVKEFQKNWNAFVKAVGQPDAVITVDGLPGPRQTWPVIDLFATKVAPVR